MLRSLQTQVAFVALVVCFPALSAAQNGFDFDIDILFLSTFDDTTDANLFGADNDAGWIYTADSTKRLEVQVMNRCPEVSIAEGGGIMRDSLRFSGPSEKVLFYQASPNLSRPQRNWSGTISLWIKPDGEHQDENVECFPLQFFDGDWRHGGFYLRCPSGSPTTIEFGAVSALDKPKHDSPDFDDIAEEQQSQIRIKDAIDNDEWTLVTLTFDGVNPAGRDNSNAHIYLNGELAGKLEHPIDVTWMNPGVSDDEQDAVVFLGVGYAGDMDDFRLYDRNLIPGEVRRLFDAAK